MKSRIKWISALITLSFVSMQSLSAQGFDFGIAAGFNSFKFDGAQSWNDRVNSGYYLGAAFELMLSDKIGFQPEVQIQFDRQKNPANETVKTKSLNVPILLTWRPIKLLSIQFGPQYSKHIDGWDDIRLLDQSFYKKDNMTLIGGLQLNTPIVKIGARIDQGLMKINNFDSMDDIKTIGFRVYLLKTLL